MGTVRINGHFVTSSPARMENDCWTKARGGLDGASRARFTVMLIDQRARLDLRDDLLESTPLEWACRWGRLEMVEVLIARGAPVDESDAKPRAMPITWAKKTNSQRTPMANEFSELFIRTSPNDVSGPNAISASIFTLR